MKEKMESYTPLEMEKIEKGRLSSWEAQELANMIITTFEGYDLKKLEPKDYEKAMEEIEEIKKWSKGEETKIEDLIEILKSIAVMGGVSYFYFGAVAKALEILSNTVSLPTWGKISVAVASSIGAFFGSMKTLNAVSDHGKMGNRIHAKEKLKNLEDETRARLEAEEKYDKSN